MTKLTGLHLNTLVRTGLSAVLLALLGACASTRHIESDVQSFTGTAPAISPATYRFERLPSQQGAAPQQDRLEAIVAPVLAKVGLTPDANSPRYSVQVQTQLDQYVQVPLGWRDPLALGYHPLRPIGPWRHWSRFDSGPEPTWFRYSAHVVLRDLSNAQVAYETRANFESSWSDSQRIWPAVIAAALTDYPKPPNGTRKVVIELPSQGTDN